MYLISISCIVSGLEHGWVSPCGYGLDVWFMSFMAVVTAHWLVLSTFPHPTLTISTEHSPPPPQVMHYCLPPSHLLHWVQSSYSVELIVLHDRAVEMANSTAMSVAKIGLSPSFCRTERKAYSPLLFFIVHIDNNWM